MFITSGWGYSLKNTMLSKAEPTDSAEIGKLLVDAWRFAYADIMPSEILYELSVEKRATGWKKYLESGVGVYISRHNSEVSGVVEVSKFRDDIKHFAVCFEIPVLYVQPLLTSKGYGYTLLKYAEERIAEKRSAGTVLWVLTENHRAIEFYKRNGFQFSGESKDHSSGLAELLYIKSSK